MASTDPINLTDETGASITLSKPAERIVCLESNCNAALALLNKVPIATVSGQAIERFGDQADTVTILGGSFFEPNVEDIVAAEPDLIIGYAGVHDALRPALEAAAPLYLITGKGYQKALDNLRTMGIFVGDPTSANAIANRFTDKLAEYKALVPKDQQKTTVVIGGSNANFYVQTSKGLAGSVLNELTRYPWLDPSDPNNGSFTLSFEELLKIDPDVIFLVTDAYGDPTVKSILLDLQTNPLWSQLKAVSSGSVHEMKETAWNSGGPYSINVILEESFPLVYPDLNK
jgi:iron complex transport system substrate-binding protein